MAGGEPAQPGLNLYIKKEHDGKERTINIGGKMELNAQPGERIVIHTPGGGGWGSPTGTPTLNSVPTVPEFELRGSVHAWRTTAEAAS